MLSRLVSLHYLEGGRSQWVRNAWLYIRIGWDLVWTLPVHAHNGGLRLVGCTTPHGNQPGLTKKKKKKKKRYEEALIMNKRII